ncbi:hypothetical protein JCM10450v2_003061 [Rhodotorula kratochvilovae]
MQVATTPAFEAVPTLSLIDSLHQSRQTLLFDTFAIFKSPSRPRTGTISESPHTLKHIATATVAIGPHSFPETQLFLCEWTQPGAVPTQPKPPTLNPGAITPALIARLNAASQTDPALAQILQKAASGQATPDELSGLARYIDVMRQEEEGAAAPAAAAAPPAPAAPASSGAQMPTHPSLVLEFRELSGGEQFILPAHYIFSPLHSHVPAPNGAQDVLLSFFVFPAERASTPSAYKGKQRAAAVGADPHAPVPVDMIVQGCGEYARECMFRAARNGRQKDEKVELWWRQMINAVPPRTHILFVPPPAPSAREGTPPADAALPASAALSRTASQHAGTPAAAAAASQKRGGTPKEAPAAKKQKTAPKRKASRPSTARSKSGSAAAFAGSPTASPGPSSLAGSPAPGTGAGAGGSFVNSPAPGSPAPSEVGSARGKGAKKGAAAQPKRKAPARRGKGKARYAEDSDDDFGEVKLEG